MERIGNFLRGAIPTPKSGAQAETSNLPIKDGSSQPSRQSMNNPHRGGEYKSSFRRRRAGASTDLTLIKGILAKALAGKGLDKKIDRYEFILHWEKIVGPKLAEVSKPDYISRRTLIVHVIHPVWAQELTFMKASLLHRLAPYLRRGDVIEDIIFRVAPLNG